MARAGSVLLLCLLLLVSSRAFAARHELKIFVLHSYHQEYPWTREVHRGFVDTLQQSLPDTAFTFATESLDSKRLPYTPELAESYFLYLQKRYRGWQPDLIFLSDDNALSFLRTYGPQLFPGVPINFCGVNRLDLRAELQPPDFQGVFEVVPVAENIALARRFDPELKKVIFVGDNSGTHQAMAQRILQVMQNYPQMEYSIVAHRQLEQVLDGLKQTSGDTLILTTIGGLVDSDGRTLPLKRSIADIARADQYRIYCMEENNLQPGVLGGELNSGWVHGQFVARQILTQREKGDQGVVVADRSPTLPMFDYDQLQRFGIPHDRLPAGAKLRNEPQSFYYQYARLVWGTLGFILFLAVIILWLFRAIHRRKIAELALREQEERLRHLAHHDSLTGLPNRLLFGARMQHAMEMAQRTRSRVAVMFLDLDRFKNVNDSLGHDLGDRLLCCIAKRLKQGGRQSDTVARLGGDEFVIALQHFDETQSVARMAERIGALLSKPIQIDGHDLYVTASIGISIYPDNGTQLEELMRCADVAMYRAKEHGGNSYQFYCPEMSVHIGERLTLEAQLRKAIDEDQLLVYYQPQIDMISGRIKVMEALVRWQHPELGMIPPAEFIPLAEETGLILPVGEYVLRQACVQNVCWQAKGLPALPVAVNLSACQFLDGEDLVTLVKRALDDTGLAGHYLHLEITESILMESEGVAEEILRKLADLGVKIAIDDFGSGYASLNYLKHFSLHKLKIDRNFILDLEEDSRDGALVSAILALAKGLDLEVVAEGVEREGQRQALIDRGCVLGQGFLFSRPLPAAAMEAFLRMQVVTHEWQKLNRQQGWTTMEPQPDATN